MAPKPKVSDACPRCGEPMRAARVPSDKEYEKAFNREQPGTLPDGSDTASPEQRAQLGALYRCGCGYQHRVLNEPATAGADQN